MSSRKKSDSPAVSAKGPKRWLQCVLIATGGIVVFAGLVYAGMIVSFTGDPAGKYASWEFFPHGPCDVLRFEAGKVTLETCCGTEDQGTYMREPDGAWIWSWERPVSVSPIETLTMTKRNHFRIERKLFHLKIQSMQGPARKLEMRRRLLNALPI